ncbi:unnamed protein product [Polarella glacialis]|uniref:Uncharacterized protein n=1 Tax=Polarella glacialis TaxID=89957 RepID=A0A813JQG4_POLGL|nr:unnamed protein product [Polarella glacialis]
MPGAGLVFAEGTKPHDGTPTAPPAGSPVVGGEDFHVQHHIATDYINAAAKKCHRRDACLYCKKEPREFETEGCGHAAACKKCAMKTATGGKCKASLPNGIRSRRDRFVDSCSQIGAASEPAIHSYVGVQKALKIKIANKYNNVKHSDCACTYHDDKATNSHHHHQQQQQEQQQPQQQEQQQQQQHKQPAINSTTCNWPAKLEPMASLVGDLSFTTLSSVARGANYNMFLILLFSAA